MHLKMGRGWEVRELWVDKKSSRLEGRGIANPRE